MSVTAAQVVSSSAQVRALLALRMAGLRGPVRRRVLIVLSLLPVLGVVAVLAGHALPAGGGQNALVLTPTAWLGFALTSLVAASSTGARTLLPRAQSVAFPIGPLAEHLGTLVLAPLNVAWLFQAFALLTLGGWGFGWAHTILPGTLLTLLWITLCTALAQLAGWLMELSRTTRTGPWVARALGLALAAGSAVLVLTGNLGSALDHAPTSWLVAAGSRVQFWRELISVRTAPALAVLALAGATGAAVLAGAALVAVLQRRTAKDQVRAEARRYPPAALPGSALALSVRLDRASVWRSVPLRRGLVTLAAIPGGAAALAGLDWHLLVLLPGLAASGAGLLFGVNAFALDSSGAVWRESLPGLPRTWFTARLIVIAEVCVVAGSEAAAIGMVRAPGWPTLAQAVSVAGSLVVSTALVAGRCARWSLAHPYAASLRDARDHPAPPAAMAGYSARLALLTTVVGLGFSVCAQFGLALVAVLMTVAGTLWGVAWVTTALRRWDDPRIRSRVVATTSG